MELALLHEDGAEPAFARVTKQLRDAYGLPIGTAHDNPILDSRMYEAECKTAMAANKNAIAQNLFAQVHADGNCHTLFCQSSHSLSSITVPSNKETTRV